MTRLDHAASALVLLAAALVPAADGQAAPNVQGASSYQGFRLPTVGGTLSYSVTLSGNASRGYYGTGGTAGFTSVSGNFALLTQSKRHPFSMIYSGGYFANLTGSAPSNSFQNLAFSEVFTQGRWTYTVSDAVSYLPQTATTGVSGVAGVGDTGTAPVDVGTGAGQGVLTYNQTRVTNSVIGSAQRRLTPSTSLSGTGSYTLSRFLNSSATSGATLNSDQYTGGASLSHRLDRRNSLGGSLTYFHVSYPGTVDPALQGNYSALSSFSAESFTFDYSRTINRQLSLFVSAGPQLTNIPKTALTGTDGQGTLTGGTGAGSSINATVGAGLTYAGPAGTASASYSRGSNTGSGVVAGANSDSLQAGATRRLTRVWNLSTSAVYSRSSSLLTSSGEPLVLNTLSATGQINRSVGRHLSAFGSYTAQRQSTPQVFATQAATVPSAFSGLSQTISAGLTYSPGVVGRTRR